MSVGVGPGAAAVSGKELGWDWAVGGRGGEDPSTWNAGLILAWFWGLGRRAPGLWDLWARAARFVLSDRFCSRKHGVRGTPSRRSVSDPKDLFFS